jgi:hypothetical protein
MGSQLFSGLTSDLWQPSCLQHRFPHLLSFAKNTNGTISDIVNTEFMEDLFHLPLSQQDFLELDQFEEICNLAISKIDNGGMDTWSYIWGSSEFLVHKAYVAMSGFQPAPLPFLLNLETSWQAKHKFFFWLLLLDRLNTRNLLGRKNFHLPSYSCATLLCTDEETLVHLFWVCPFAEKC